MEMERSFFEKRVKTSGEHIHLYVLLVVTIIIGYPNTYDIPFFDSRSYLNNGVSLNLHAPAPLYSLWYKLLSLLGFNGLNLYHLDHVLLLSLSTVVLYFFSKRSGFTAGISFLIAISFALMSSYYKVMRVSHLGLLIAVAGLYLAEGHFQNKKNSVLYFTALTLTFIRAEYLFSVVTILLFFVRDWKKVTVFLIITIILFFTFNNPFSGGRLLQALQQHYSFHYSLWYPVSGNPWDYDIYSKASFDIFLYLRFCLENTVLVVPVIFWLFYRRISGTNLIFILPALAISILIFPRPHYLIPIIPFLLSVENKNKKIFEYRTLPNNQITELKLKKQKHRVLR